MTTTPENANQGCVGPESSTAGKSSACAGCPNKNECSSGAFKSTPAQKQKIQSEKDTIRNSLSGVSHIILVLSGKGGVGKSTVSSQLAFTLSHRGYTVGILDVDICGPSIPRMTGCTAREVHQSGSGWSPVYVSPTLSVMSVAFLLPDPDSAVVWRGPRKNGMIKQFLTETNWGDEGLDYLIVDTPPGTSDEHISTVQYLQGMGNIGGAILVTTPEEVSMADVRKELNFCQKVNLNVLGIVENMGKMRVRMDKLKFYRTNDENGLEEECTEHVVKYIEEKCPELMGLVAEADVFPPYKRGPSGMAEQFGVPYLGCLPLDPNLLKACEEGVCFVQAYEDSSAFEPLNSIVDKVLLALPVEDDCNDD